jgi:hypothetical protein
VLESLTIKILATPQLRRYGSYRLKQAIIMYNAMSTDAAQDVENILAAMVLVVAYYVLV